MGCGCGKKTSSRVTSSGVPQTQAQPRTDAAQVFKAASIKQPSSVVRKTV